MKRRFFLLAVALLGCPLVALAVPSIKIDSVTPDGPWQPGDSLNLAVKVSYAEAPWPGSVDFVIVEESETGTKTVTPLGASSSVDFAVRAATKTLQARFYQVPYRSCFLRQTSGLPQCFTTAPTLAATLTRLKKLTVMARLLDGSKKEILTASREVEIKNPEVTSLGVKSQPLNTERKQRVVVEGAKFTEADPNVPISVYYVKVGDPKIYLSATGYNNPNPAFNRACKPPRGGESSNNGACDFQIINDTTLEFTQRDFRSPVTPGDLLPDSIFQPYLGAYDVYVLWGQKAPSAEFNFRNPDAVLLNAFTVTAPLKEDSVEITKITLTANTNPATKTEEFTPGGETSYSFAPNANVIATVEFEYNLTRRLGCSIWFLARKPGQTVTMGFPRSGLFWNTLGKSVASDGSDPPRQSNFLLSVPIPADGGGLEFSLVMTDIQAPFATFEQDAFVKSRPFVLTADKLGLSNLKPEKEQIRAGAKIQISADVEYLLKTRNQADLALRVFDENGVLVATSIVPNADPNAPDKFHRVSKATAAATLPLVTQPFIVPATKKLRIKAVFIDLLQPGVFHESPITEYELTIPKLRVGLKEAKADVFAGDRVDLDVSVVKDDGSVNEDFSGEVRLRFDTEQGKKGVGTFLTGRGVSTDLLVKIEKGRLSEEVSLRTPEKQLRPESAITPETVLEGKAVIVAELAGAPETSANHIVEVRSPLDLMIDRIELQQGVNQSIAIEQPMIASRPVLARVFVSSNTGRFNAFSRVEGVTAKLVVRGGDGQEIPGSPFALKSSLADLRVAAKPAFELIADPSKLTPSDLAAGKDSLNLILPALDAGTISLEATLDKTHRELKEENANQNSATLGPIAFAPSREFKVLYSKAKLQSRTGTSEFPSDLSVQESIRFLQQVYPVGPNVRFIERPGETLAGSPFERSRFSRFWHWLNRPSGVEAQVYFVDSQYFPGVADPGILGRGSASLALAVVNSDTCSGVGSDCSTLPHEVGHILGLGDTYHDVISQPNMTTNPRKNLAEGNFGQGNPVEHGSYNWFENRFAVVDLRTNFSTFQDFMGNNPQPWTEARAWNYLKRKFIQPQAAGEERTYLIAEGAVTKNGGQFQDCYTLRGVDLADASLGGSHAVVTLDAGGAELDRFDFNPEFRLSHATVDLDEAFFSHALPLSDKARTIQLRSGAAVLATREISANAPVVNFVTDLAGKTLSGDVELAWSGFDADGQVLRYSLYYSPDGKLQLPLAEGIESTGHEWDTDQSPSGSAPRLTLVATDGVLATITQSAVFKLPNRAPRISIFSPLADAVVAPGSSVILDGGLYDPEVGLSTNANLTWTSDKQGPLGVGPTIGAILTEGPHRLTATGTDEAGLTASASVNVLVGVAAPVTLAVSREAGQFRLAWPTSTNGFVPQTAEDLIKWRPLTDAITSANGENTLRLPFTGRAAFFRLAKP